jgi:hypothetical protein
MVNMNIRGEFRQAFRQYRGRLGLALSKPCDEVIGDLCFFDIDGAIVSLGNIFDRDDEEEEKNKKRITRTVDSDVDPIISNGMGCRTLSESERAEYVFDIALT